MRAPPTLPGLDLAVVSTVKPRVSKPATPSGRAKKGSRVERELAALHAELGIRAARVPLSGALAKRLGPEFGGDLKIWLFGDDAAPLIGEVKARGSGGGFLTLERWLASHDLMFFKKNGTAPMVVVPWRTWALIIERSRS